MALPEGKTRQQITSCIFALGVISALFLYDAAVWSARADNAIQGGKSVWLDIFMAVAFWLAAALSLWRMRSTLKRLVSPED